MNTYIIAEAGVNHNGSLELAKKLVDVAKEAGVDSVKFQTFKSEYLVTKTARKADYQTDNTQNEESQYEMLKKLELSYSDFEELFNYCKKKEIDFLSTPFDMESAEFLNSIGMKIWKIPSGEITNLPLLQYIGSRNSKIILSTGMSDIEEVEDAVKVLNESGKNEIILLHCTTQYPAPYESVNLKAMCTLRDRFDIDVGYSDHTTGSEVAVAAVSLGAKVIEKHFTLDRTMDGPDHKASVEPNELRQLVSSIRNIELALGDGNKRIQEAELNNRDIARKSIVARSDIKKGEIITESMLIMKRPGTGVSPMRLNEVLGTRAKKDFHEDDMIQI